MGHAAYMRGSRLISAQICRDTGCPGCVRCRPDPKPTPRPEGWGSKARQRAETVARSCVSGAERYGLPRPSVEALILAVQQRARVGESTARAAAMAALMPDPEVVSGG